MISSIVNRNFFDVLSSHLYTSKQNYSMYSHIPYETVIEGRKVSIINVNWVSQMRRWAEQHSKIANRNAAVQESALYRYLKELDSSTIVVFNTAFECYYMHTDQNTSRRIKEIIQTTKIPFDKFVVLTPNKDEFLKHGGWETKMNVLELNGLFQIYYDTRKRIESIDENLRTKHFSSLNGTSRLHRVDLFTFLRIEDMLNKVHYTFNAVNSDERWKKVQAGHTYYSRTFHEAIDLTLFTKGSFQLEAKDIEQRTLQHNDLPDFYWTDAYIHILTESCYFDYAYKNFYTEKTMKIFDNYQIPIVIGTSGYVTYLRSNGYHMFDNIIDHSYDDIKDDRLRFAAVAKEIKRLASMPVAQIHELYHQNKESLIHNREQLHRHYLRMYEEFDRRFKQIIHEN
jgi:hypothetical protein